MCSAGAASTQIETQSAIAVMATLSRDGRVRSIDNSRILPEPGVANSRGLGFVRVAMCLLAMAFARRALGAATPPLLPEPVIAAFANELDGDRAKRDVEVFAQLHRMRASEPF